MFISYGWKQRLSSSLSWPPTNSATKLLSSLKGLGSEYGMALPSVCSPSARVWKLYMRREAERAQLDEGS